jgi:hypothetical protein
MSVRIASRQHPGMYGLVVQNGPWENGGTIRPYVVRSGGIPPLSVVAKRVVKDQPVLISNSGSREDYYAKKYRETPGRKLQVHKDGRLDMVVGGQPQNDRSTDMLDLPSMPAEIKPEMIASAPPEETINNYLSELPEFIDEVAPSRLEDYVTNPRWSQRLLEAVASGSSSAMTLFSAGLNEYLSNTVLTREALSLGAEGATLALTPEYLRPMVRNVLNGIRSGRDFLGTYENARNQALVTSMRTIFDQIEGYTGTRTLPDFDPATATLDFTQTQQNVRMGVYNFINTILLLLASLQPGGRRLLTGATRSGATFRPQIMPGSF